MRRLPMDQVAFLDKLYQENNVEIEDDRYDGVDLCIISSLMWYL